MKRNLLHIDEIRFLVIHIILINHWSLNLYITNTPIDKTLINYWFFCTSPALALISGYLFFYKTKERFRFAEKAKSRWHSLVIPYLFWTLTFYVLYVVIKEEYAHIFHSTLWYAPVQSLSLRSLINTIVHPPLVNFWYLQNLILIIPFNFFIYYLLKNRYIFIALFLLVIAIYSFNLLDIYFQPRFLPYYLMGCYFGYYEKYIPTVRLNKLAAFLVIPALFVIIGWASNLQDNNLPDLLLKIVLTLLFVFTIYNVLDSNQNSWLFRYLKKYKPYSFFLFAINMFLFSFVQRTLLKLGAAKYLDNKYFALLFLIVSLVAVLCLAFIIARFLKNHLTKFYHAITGR